MRRESSVRARAGLERDCGFFCESLSLSLSLSHSLSLSPLTCLLCPSVYTFPLPCSSPLSLSLSFSLYQVFVPPPKTNPGFVALTPSLNFGQLELGKVSMKTIELINKTKAQAFYQFVTEPTGCFELSRADG